MKKIKCSVQYPYVDIEDDEYVIEVDDSATEEEIDAVAEEVFKDLISNRIITKWEEI